MFNVFQFVRSSKLTNDSMFVRREFRTLFDVSSFRGRTAAIISISNVSNAQPSLASRGRKKRYILKLRNMYQPSGCLFCIQAHYLVLWW